MNTVYFDSAATAIPLECAKEAAANAFGVFGNPSSVHSAGLNAKFLIDNARKSVSAALYCKPEEIIFTGCGSEGNNQAIFGLAKLRARRSKRIITDDSEHPSVSLTLAQLEGMGYEVVRISTKNGVLDIEQLENELSLGAAFVAIMLVNNETGAKYDIPAVRRAIDKSGCGALFFCDAVQGFLKVENPREIVKNCDVASVSAHKIGGLKGVGALYIKSGIKLPAFIHGGGQEGGLRSGTENVVGISAFGAACAEFPKFSAHISSLYDKAVELLQPYGDILKLNIPINHVKSILSVSIHGVRSEVMLNALDLHGICISAGSACSARKANSSTLVAYGLTKGEIEGTVRISFGAYNTLSEVEFLVEKLVETAKKLKR